MFLSGWHLNEYLTKKEMKNIQDEIFGTELSSKRAPSYIIVVDTAYKYLLDIAEQNNNTFLLSTLLVIKSKIKEYFILFDVDNELEKILYENVLNLSIRNI